MDLNDMTGYEFLDEYCDEVAKKCILYLERCMEVKLDSSISEFSSKPSKAYHPDGAYEYNCLSDEEKILCNIIGEINPLLGRNFITNYKGVTYTDSDIYINPDLVKHFMKDKYSWEKIIKFLSDGTSN